MKLVKATSFYIFILIAAGFIFYGHTLGFSLSPLDDYELFVKKMDWLEHISNLPALFTGSLDSTVNAPYYRPILMSSFMADAIIGQGNLLMFHLTNLMIHISVSILVFIFFQQLNFSRTLSLFWSLLFLAHPIHVTAVAWLPGRNDSLLTLFSLTAVVSLIQYYRSPRIRWLIIHVISFILATYTKEQGILLLFIFGLIAYHFRLKLSVKQLLVLWFISCFLFLIPHKLIMTGGFILNIDSYNSYFSDCAAGFVISIGKLGLPIYQSVLPTILDTPLWPGLIVSLFMAMGVIFSGIRNKGIFIFGLAWYMLTISLPLLWGALQGEYFEHRLYLPSVGFFLMISQLKIFEGSDKKYQPLLILGMIILMMSLGTKTWRRSQIYRDELSFATAAVQESPSHDNAYYLLGNVHRSHRNWEKSIVAYDMAIALNPRFADAINNRGDTFLKLKSFALALKDFNLVLAIKPNDLSVINNRAVTYYFLKEYNLAWKDVRYILDHGGKVHPDFLVALSDQTGEFP